MWIEAAMSSQPSYIDTLPNELLAEIFRTNRSRERSDPYARLPPEVLYSHVSRRWRDVSTNLPTLWARIHVNARSSLLWLPHYLSRSQPCHLDLKIDHRHLDSCYGLEHRINRITRAMNFLIPHIDRWSRLSVAGRYEYSNYLVLSHLHNLRAPVLRELNVYVDEVVESMEGNSPLEILQGGAPLLTSIDMDILHRCRPPVSALTTCRIDRCNRSLMCMEFVQVLASSHALTKLCVYGRAEKYCEESWQFSRSPLDALKSLELRLTYHFTSPLLLAISAPRLETLQLKDIEDDDLHMLFNSPHRSLVEFPALHTLSLCSVGLNNNSYIQLSRMFPSITHLKVRCVSPIDLQDLAELIGSPGASDGGRATVIWPKLHTIMIGYLLHRDPRTQSDPIGEVLCNLLAARRALGRPIERLLLIDRVLDMVEGTDGLGGYVELWEHPYEDEV